MKQLSCIVSEQSYGHDFHGKGHTFNVEGQKVKITPKCIGSILDYHNALTIWSKCHV